ncbi:MAG: hypothetical protein ACI9OJ_001874 [Myxococcota bacterium]|jgi:hypothetical protein
MFEHKSAPKPTQAPSPLTSNASRSPLAGQSMSAQQEQLRPGGSGYAAQAAALSPNSAAAEPALMPFLTPAASTVAQGQAVVAESSSSLLDDLAGWAGFAVTAIKYIEVGGMIDRARNISRVVGEVQGGADVAALGIDPSDHRLANVAQMQSVMDAHQKDGHQTAAHGLRDANAAFYVLLGNNAGRFDGMDMERYRKIGALGVDEAAKVLPDFEADLFAGQTDEGTIEFGNSLSARHRGQLFEVYNSGISLVQKGDRALDKLGQAASDAAAWTRDLFGMGK